MNAIRALLAESIDYAGLFPPAGLDMATAVENYARYRAEPAAWALGRFVVPVARLGELEAAARLMPASRLKPSWRLALVAGPDLVQDLGLVAEFNRHQTQSDGPFVADTIEVKATSVRDIEDIMHRIPGTLQAYIEVPLDPDPRNLLGAIHSLGGRAKVRTGGVTRDAFPTTSHLTRFLRGSVQAALPFKATAGLHHPLRGEYRLTYASDSPAGAMFGFLNLFLATAFLRAGIPEIDAARLLEEGSPEALQLDESGVAWEGYRLDLDGLRAARRQGVVSFGSCSFTEPIGDLEALHLLGAEARHG
ncbi:MAG TPA: hypothetical protein VIG04_07740 [Gemmatimonadales bacterium]